MNSRVKIPSSGDLQKLIPPGPLRIPLLIVAAAFLAGLLLALSTIVEPSFNLAAVMIVCYVLGGTILSYVVGKKTGDQDLLASVFIITVLVRFLLAIVFHFNHDALEATGLSDDDKYFEAGFIVARMIREGQILQLLDLQTIYGQVNQINWTLYYFDALHFLVGQSLLLPVLSLGMINALSGLMLFRVTYLIGGGRRTAKFAFLLWMFSPSAIGWSAINHKESLVVAFLLVILWAIYSRRRPELRIGAMLISLVLLAGLRWYVSLLLAVIALAKLAIDRTGFSRFSVSRLLMILVLIAVLVNMVSLVPAVFRGNHLSLGEASRIFQEVTERAWSRTDKVFASAQRARSISPVLSYGVTLFALLFTPPPTRWLGIQEFRVLGALLFYFVFAYSIWGTIWMLQKDKGTYWPLIAVAVLIPLMLANVPTLVGSRHRFQVEPVFTIIASFGMVKAGAQSRHIYSVIAALLITFFSAAVDLLF